MAARQGLAPADLLRELDHSHRALLNATSGLPDEHFTEGKAAPGLIDGVAGGHYQEHVGADPAVARAMSSQTVVVSRPR